MMRLYVFACFISLCSAVTGCNPDWLSYNQKCYRAVAFPYDVRLARRYCQIFRGDLATINDNATLHNFGLALSQPSEGSYWVNENSGIPASATTNSCSYVYYDGKTQELRPDGDCTEGKYFICEVADEDKDVICPKSWSLYGSSCYKTFKNGGTYTQAVAYCSLQRSQLAVLDDITKEHNAAAVIIGQKQAYLVAAKKTCCNETDNNSYAWSTGKVFQPSCSECRNNTPGDCIGFSSDPQHPTMFTWVNLNCNSSNYYLCEMKPEIRITTPQPTTTLTPLQCPVGYNWKEHEASGFCYWETTYESERLNWFQARQFCQAYGGDLATYDNANQEEHGLGGAKGHYRGLWFGLKRDENDVFRWVDGSTPSYTNWHYNEPNLKSRSKFCVMHGPSNSEWELDYCGVRRWFVCKSNKTREPRVPDIDLFKKTPCNFSGPSVHRTQWYLYNDHCYLVHDEAKYSWDTARYFCQDNGGHMVSVHSFQETDFILQAIPNAASNTDYWIGLSARGLDSSLSWSDGTPLDFLYWGDDFNGTEGIDKCMTLEKQRGFWKTEHCNRFLGVICKRGVNASYDFPTPEPTPVLPGNCETGWYRFGNKCFKTFGEKWSQRSNWDEALSNCKKLDAMLLSIHSGDEQDFVTDLLLDLGTAAWIGLENINKGTVFKWNDDGPLDYTNWNVNEPMNPGSLVDEIDPSFPISNQGRLCVELDYDITSVGKWSDINCHRSKAYICQKNPNPNLTEQSQDPFICSNITGWKRLGSSCYSIFEDEGQQLDWVAAQAKCRTFGANLAVFRSSAVAIFLKKRIKMKDQFFWIGARETKKNTYVPVVGGSVYSNWLSGQPQRTSDVDNCVSVNSDGKWLVKNCKEKHPFICELSSAEEELLETAEENNLCPTPVGWKNLGGDNCYFFGYRSVNWNDALFLCYKHGGHLASFHSSTEMTLVKDYLLKNSVTESSFHIGLGKKSDGSYGWVDHSPLDFTYWEYDPPLRSLMNCVQLHPKTAKWRPVGCDDMLRNYLCSFPRRNTNNVDSNITEVSRRSQEEAVSYKLGASGILGIIVCVLIILGVIGGTVYRLYPTSIVKPTLLEPDGL